MLVNSYLDLNIKDQVKVKKSVIDDLLLNNISTALKEHIEVLKFVLIHKDILTIASIEIKPMIYVRAALTFEECSGSLYNDQVYKINNASSFYYIFK